MKNLEKLRKIIIKEIPEIIELKFGCEIKYNFGGKKKDIIAYVEDNDNIGTVSGGLHTALGEFEIIGRPISISDVLRVMGGVLNGSCSCLFKKSDLDNFIFRKWNLEEDDINKQSEDTIDFLYNLLK